MLVQNVSGAYILRIRPKVPLCLMIISSLLLFGCEPDYVDYIEHIESPDGHYNYCLCTDGMGVGYPVFKVLR